MTHDFNTCHSCLRTGYAFLHPNLELMAHGGQLFYQGIVTITQNGIFSDCWQGKGPRDQWHWRSDGIQHNGLRPSSTSSMVRCPRLINGVQSTRPDTPR